MRSAEARAQVPYSRLPVEVLRRVTEEFATRDGTDCREVEKTLEEKVADVKRQLETETSDIIRTEDPMGDKSPKSKLRDQKQKNAAKATDTATAKSKQDAHSRAPLPGPRGKK